jgi:hypothetical protein
MLARHTDLIWSASTAKIYAAVDKQTGGSARSPKPPYRTA